MTVLVADDFEFGGGQNIEFFFMAQLSGGIVYQSGGGTAALRRKDGNYSAGADVNSFLSYQIPASSEIYISVFMVPVSGAGKEIIWRSAGVELGSLRWNTGKKYDIHIGTDATAEALGTTIVGALQPDGGAMKNYQLRIKIGNTTTGSVQFKLEGNLETSYDAQDTQPGAETTIDEIMFGNNVYIDDVWINDTNGSYNNGWPGIVRASTQFPDGVGATSDFIGSAGGAKNLLVDEQPLSGTDYVYSETIGDIQKFTYPAPVIPNNSQVLAVAVYDGAYKVSEGNIIHGLQIAGSDAFSADKTLNTGYFTGSGRAHYSESNPNTSAVWLPTDNPTTYFKHNS